MTENKPAALQRVNDSSSDTPQEEPYCSRQTTRDFRIGTSPSPNQNLSLVMLLLSIGVVLHHSQFLSYLPVMPIPWAEAFFGFKEESLGTWCVDGFLVFSGYMLSLSVDSAKGGFKDALVFAIKRLIRIFPGILFAAIIAVFVVGPMFTTLELDTYFDSSATWEYLGKSLNLFARPPLLLPGVFEVNAYKQIVNGSLWMIPWLMWCYALFMVALLFRLHKNRMTIAILWVLSLYCRTIEHDINPAAMFCGLWAHDGLRLLGGFITGWALYLFRDRIAFDWRFALAMLATTPFWLHSDAHAPVSCLLVGYILCTFCFHVRTLPCIHWLPRIHWEIYLLSFMVQQCVTAAHGGSMSPRLNFIYSLAITIPLAMALHLLVDWTSKPLRKSLLSLVERQKRTNA